MARKPASKPEVADPIDMLSLIDQDAPADAPRVVVVEAEPQPPAVISRRAAAVVLQNPERFDRFYDRMRDRLADYKPDLSTAAGRKECASKAFEVTKVKTTLDKAGLELTEDWRRKTKAVNDARKPMVQRLDQLAEEVRAPLTAWEAAEDARQSANLDTLNRIRADGQVRDDDTAESVAERGRVVFRMTFEAPQWSEYEAAEAEGAKQATVAALVAAQKRLLQEEADRAELARLRAEAAERAEADRLKAEEAERKAAEEAAAEAERLRVEREQQAEAERIERERVAEEQRQAAEIARLERERQEAADAARREAEEAAAEERRQRDAEHAAELKAAQDERDRIEREAREAQEARDAAEAQRIADEQAARDREAAAQAERDREAAEAARVERERQANAEHRRTVLAEVASDIVDACAGLPDDVARDIANAIASGQVRHAAVSF